MSANPTPTKSPLDVAREFCAGNPEALPTGKYKVVDRVDRKNGRQAEHLTDKGTDKVLEHVAEETIHASASHILKRFEDQALADSDSAEISPEAQARYVKKIAQSVEFWSDPGNAARRIMGLYLHSLLYASPTAPVLLVCAGMLKSGEIEVECVCDYLRIKRVKAAPTANNDTFDLGDGLGLPVGDGPSAPLAAHNGVEGELASEGGAA